MASFYVRFLGEETKSLICKVSQHGVEKSGPIDPLNCCLEDLLGLEAKSFMVALLQYIINDMNRYWPNLRNYPNGNLGFWQYEWAQHGMCSAHPAQPVTYFNDALQERKRYDIQQIFRNYGIVPSNIRNYNRTDMSNALNGGVGVRPEIHCNTDSGNVVQLMEVRICFDVQLNRINCPRPFTACPVANLVRYPS
ncbi:ribonuclease 3-like [Tripterygium wilfordii]|uniref:ribonuclease 3-like n=1 Tax=Tripterygium wilfordii TaxID=458696 RepID=UPI0018F845CA|nr:ribonuclease 3-like [Tripterygium wilfordii]